MIGLVRFAKSRRWATVVLVCVGTAGLLVLLRHASYTLIPRGSYVLAVAGQLPVIPAIALQATVDAGLGRQESLAARPLSPWRLAHVLVMTMGATICLGVPAVILASLTGNNEPVSALTLIRNLLAFIGVSLVGAALVGRWFAWLFPVGWVTVPYLFIARPTDDPIGILTLSTQPGTASVAGIFACSIWAVGTLVTVCDIRFGRGCFWQAR